MSRKNRSALGSAIDLHDVTTSGERIDHARKAFKVSLTTLTDAETYGTAVHAAAAARAFMEAAEIYSSALQEHARIVADYAADRAAGSL
jgi:hypothetical protein